MKKHFFLIFGLLLMLSDANAATTIDDGAFGTVWDALVAWMHGSLGYTIALLGMLGSIVMYLIWDFLPGTHNRLTILFAGILLSIFTGGAVGIVQMMSDLGQSTF